MKKATVISSVIITAIFTMILALLLIVGGAIVFYMYGALEEFMFIFLVLIGLGVIISSLPTAISGIIRVIKHKRIAPLIFSEATLLLGVLLLCQGIGSIVLFYHSFNDQGEFDMALHAVNLLIGTLAALGLILLPVLSIVLSKSKDLQYRVEIHKPLIGAVIEMLLLTHAFDDKLASGCGIVMMIFGIITAVFSIVYLVAGLAGLSKAIKRAKEKEQSTVEQSDSVLLMVQKQVPDLPFGLPAGVNPDDL